MSSLLASVLLLIALMLGAVLLFDFWRSYRIRRARRASDETSNARSRDPAKSGSLVRGASSEAQPGVSAPVPSQTSVLAQPAGQGVSGQGESTEANSAAASLTPVAEPAAVRVPAALVRDEPVHAESVRVEPARDAASRGGAGHVEPAHAESVYVEPGRVAAARDEPVFSEPLFPATGGVQSGRAEPSFGSLFEGLPVSDPVPSSAEPVAAQARSTDIQAMAAENSPAPPARSPQPRQPPLDRVAASSVRVAAASSLGAPATLSERTDCLVVLRSERVLDADRVMLLVQDFRRVGAKPVLVEACAEAIDPAPMPGSPASPVADATKTAEPRWHGLSKGGQYRALRLGLLLANRGGPLNAMEFSDFIARVRQLGERLGCRVLAPDMAGVLARARSLDAECLRLDAQVGLNVQTARTLSPAELAGLAAPLAVSERGNNRFARLTAQGQLVFSVALADEPKRLSLLLDVPRVPEALRPWSAMADCARLAAQHLDGQLVDDTGRELSDRAVEQIGLQLAHRYRELETAGLSAGSAAALRVFN